MFQGRSWCLTLRVVESKLNVYLNDSVNINIHAFLSTCSGACMEDKQELKRLTNIVHEFQVSIHSQSNTSPHSYLYSILPSQIISFLFFKYILLIMVLQLSHFFPPCHTPPYTSLPTCIPPALSSCPWVIHISSSASPFPILFLTSPCLFCTYCLCFLFPVPLPHSLPSFTPLLIALHVISISVILFLF